MKLISCKPRLSFNLIYIQLGTVVIKWERHKMSTWTWYVKIWTVNNCEFNANFLAFLDLYDLLIVLGTIETSEIIIWWLIPSWEKSFQFWRGIWIWVAVVLLQLYQCLNIFMELVDPLSKVFAVFKYIKFRFSKKAEGHKIWNNLPQDLTFT